MDLNKALRAMHHSETWRNSVEAAAMFAGVEYTPQLLADMTKQHLDDLVLDEVTQEVQVPQTLGTNLVETVEEWEPTDLGDNPKAVTKRLVAIETKLEREQQLTELFLATIEDPDEPPTWEDLGGIWPAGTILEEDGKVYRNVTMAPLTTPPSRFPGGPRAWTHLFVQENEEEEDSPKPWMQPLGATDAYQQGDVVTHDGDVWVSTVDSNVWEPGAYGWVLEEEQ